MKLEISTDIESQALALKSSGFEPKDFSLTKAI
jgi:hypothetical protein